MERTRYMSDDEVRELLDGLTDQEKLILHELLLILQQNHELFERLLSE